MALDANTLSDADLDRLLAASEPKPAAPTAPASGPVDADKLSDADLDRLLAASSGGPPTTPVGRGAIGLSGPGSTDPDPIKLAPMPAVLPGESKVPGAQLAPDMYQTGSLGGDLKEMGRGTVEGFKQIGSTLHDANTEAATTIVHPGRVLDERWRNETMRGVNADIPGGTKLAALAGFAATSDADKAAYPTANALGAVAGMAVPLPIGEAVGAVGRAGAALVKPGVVATALGEAAAKREVERAAEAYGLGAAKKARAKLQGNILDEDPGAGFRRVLTDSPELVAAAHGTDADRAQAALGVARQGAAELRDVYTGADETRGVRRGGPVATDLTAAAERAEDRTQALITEREALPADSVAREKLGKSISESQHVASTLRRKAAEKITATRTIGVRPWDALEPWDAKIAELGKGTASERATADKLAALRNEYKAAFGEHQTVPAEELRRWQTDYQGAGYGKAIPGDPAATANIAANQEASKIVGDPIVKHVTGMSYADAAKAAEKDPTSVAGRLFAANEKVAVGNNVLAAVRSRVGNNPGAPHRLSALIHSAELGQHVAAAAMTGGHSLPAQAIFGAVKHRHAIGAAADRAAIGAVSSADHASQGLRALAGSAANPTRATRAAGGASVMLGNRAVSALAGDDDDTR